MIAGTSMGRDRAEEEPWDETIRPADRPPAADLPAPARSARVAAKVRPEVGLKQAELERQGFSIAELRQMARRRLPRMVFDFCDGGAEDERTRERNETGFADWELLPRPLNGTGERSQATELFGQRLALPVIIGPTGLSGMMWPKGELAAARAAAARRHGLHDEPRLDDRDRGPRAAGRGAALVPELHVPRPRPHPLVRRARAGRGLPGSRADDRQPDARPARARPAQRLRDPAAGQLAERARRRTRLALGAARRAHASSPSPTT